MGGRDSFARVQILTGVHRCSTALISRPLVTQCATLFGLFAPGDVLAQQAFEKKGAKPNGTSSLPRASTPPSLCVGPERLHVQF